LSILDTLFGVLKTQPKNEWPIDSFQGADGKTGISNSYGPQGHTGPLGPQGWQGSPGIVVPKKDLITIEDILRVCPHATGVDRFIPTLNTEFDRFSIITTNRKAMFLAQVLVETGGFKWLKEVWGNPPTNWQAHYEFSKSLGNTQAGDGKKFMGRGLIQLTGRANYEAFAAWMNDPNIVVNPSSVATDNKLAVMAAIFFWERNHLNRFADLDDIASCTRRINGAGMLHEELREQYYAIGKEVLGS